MQDVAVNPVEQTVPVEYYWDNFFSAINTYPPNYPNIRRSFDGLNIDDIVMSSLNPNVYVEDNVMNAFFKMVMDRDPSVLAFDTFFSEDIIRNGELSTGFHHFASKIDYTAYKILLMPTHLIFSNHWVMSGIIPSLRMFIYLCSGHSMPSPSLIDKLCGFYELYVTPKRKTLVNRENWSEWTLYVPRDIPPQYGVDCGVHVMTWGNIICNGRNLAYTDDDMIHARKSVANMIAFTKANFKGPLFLADHNPGKPKPLEKTGYGKMKLLRHPPIMGFPSSLEFFASLHLLYDACL